MTDILNAPIPEQRWALPTDSEYDTYYNEFEAWLNENYDMETLSINGRHITWEDACESEDVFEDFMDELRSWRDI